MAINVVRKHRAPKGALRLLATAAREVGPERVRKHRAPKGALRHPCPESPGTPARSQKAPSAKRCIKTGQNVFVAADRALVSESTERQKVH